MPRPGVDVASGPTAQRRSPALDSGASGCSGRGHGPGRVEGWAAGLAGELCACLASHPSPAPAHGQGHLPGRRKGHLDHPEMAHWEHSGAGTSPWPSAGAAHRGGCGRAAQRCPWGLGRCFLTVPAETHASGLAACHGACREAVPRGRPDAQRQASQGHQEGASLLEGQGSTHHVLCPQPTGAEHPGLCCPPPAPGLCPESHHPGPRAPRCASGEGRTGTGGRDPGVGAG